MRHPIRKEPLYPNGIQGLRMERSDCQGTDSVSRMEITHRTRFG
jgi:hypothetical protein